jgi:quercetin dioxygenase-like cupin family protein
VSGFRVTRHGDNEVIHYGTKSDLRVLVGDDEGSTPVRVAIQTCEPGYDVPVHCHPYIEYLIVLEGSARFRIETDGIQTVELRKGDTVELRPGVWHAFTTSAHEVTRLMGIHLSSERIVNYKSTVKTDARGFRIEEDATSAPTR